MRALILAAGLGTRLRPLTLIRAKGAVPVNGEPLVRRVIGWLASQGIREVVVNLHHRPETIARVVGDGSDLGVQVRYSWEDPILGSAGGPRRALPLLGDSFLLVNGDTLTDLDIAGLLEAHTRSGALVTMALIRNPRPDHYGGVTLQDGWITGFTRPGTAGPSYHFIGVQAARAAAFVALPDGQPAESVMGLYPQLMREVPRALLGYVVEAPFRDIGTPADYLQTSLELAGSEGDRLVSQHAVRMAASARLVRTTVWDDVEIGADVRLDECVVADGAVVPPASVYRRCSLVPYSGRALVAGERLDGALLVRPF